MPMRDFQQPGRSPVFASNAMVSTSHPLSSAAALDVLRKGGNAVDAALAAVSVQCVVEPASTSVGGDCFCLYAPVDSQYPVAMNGSGRAPKRLSLDWMIANGYDSIPQQSPHSVTVPTAVDAWVTLNKDYGTKPLGDLLQYAIEYARDGYPVGQRVAFDFANTSDLIKQDKDLSKLFLFNGKTLPNGFYHKQPNLAKTLTEIGKNGRDGFFSGWVADDIIKKLNSLGGFHQKDDFDDAIANYVKPISSEFRGYKIWQCPPNGQGVIALLLLNMASEMNCFGDDPINLERMHYEIEAGKLAYRDRSAVLADPKFHSVPVDQLLSKKYAKELLSQIRADKAISSLPTSTLPKHSNTVYITVIDQNRNACSLINTVYNSFGSGLLAPKSGVLLHNRGMGFVLEEGHPNCLEPGKRPLHTIIPGLVTKDDKLVMSYGVMGGEYQAFGHMQFLSRFFDYGLDIQSAQDKPRFFPDPFSENIDMETTIPRSIQNDLVKMGHQVRKASIPIGGSQAIHLDQISNVLTAGSDPRKDGLAVGF